jgi:putative Mn2+ efflux pump MntP
VSVVLTAILFALSLCADCFAVSLCSGITMGKVTRKDTLVVASAFAVIQTAFLMIGWAFGSAVAPLIGRVAPWIGFLLLLYVGGSMVLEGIKGEAEALNLNGFRNIVL